MLHKSRHAIKTVDIPYWHTRSEDGVVLPAFLDQDKIVDIRQRKIQTEDVFVASFPKSGSTWMKSMLMDLLKAEVPMYSAYPAPYIDSLKSPRIFKEHLPLHLLPDDVRKCKVIYLVRNPKDVVVSFQHHMTLFKIDEYSEDLNVMVDLFCTGKTQFGDWCSSIRDWCFQDQVPSLHIVTYEDLTRDCFTTMKSVLKFLDQDISDDLVREVVENSKFSQMKKRDLNYVPGCPSFLGKSAMRDDKKHFLREGKVGTWKKHLTVENDEKLDQYLQADMELFLKIKELNIL